MDAITIATLVCVTVIALLSLGLLVIWAANIRIDKKMQELNVKEDDGTQHSELVKDVVYLRVKDGRAGIIRELPVRVETVIKEVSPAPLVEEYKPGEPAPEVTAEPLQETVARPAEELEETAVSDAAQEEDADTVRTITLGGESLTFEQRFALLDEESQNLYQAFAERVCADPLVRVVKNRANITIRYRTERMLRVIIRRGVLVLQFELVNNELKRYVKKNEQKSVKMNAVAVRLQNQEDLAAAVQTAEITKDNLEREYQYRKEVRRKIRAERERERRRRLALAAQSSKPDSDAVQAEEAEPGKMEAENADVDITETGETGGVDPGEVSDGNPEEN